MLKSASTSSTEISHWKYMGVQPHFLKRSAYNMFVIVYAWHFRLKLLYNSEATRSYALRKKWNILAINVKTLQGALRLTSAAFCILGQLPVCFWTLLSYWLQLGFLYSIEDQDKDCFTVVFWLMHMAGMLICSFHTNVFKQDAHYWKLQMLFWGVVEYGATLPVQDYHWFEWF